QGDGGQAEQGRQKGATQQHGSSPGLKKAPVAGRADRVVATVARGNPLPHTAAGAGWCPGGRSRLQKELRAAQAVVSMAEGKWRKQQ
ncbi:MAG: hypothetical protein ACT6XY_12305, partial [Phreatobacter sp.]|uniref:hypothetical protein n=1 Tax=Phreatobacter sp. TaxID=1966341 RepID=UPI004036CC7D